MIEQSDFWPEAPNIEHHSDSGSEAGCVCALQASQGSNNLDITYPFCFFSTDDQRIRTNSCFSNHGRNANWCALARTATTWGRPLTANNSARWRYRFPQSRLRRTSMRSSMAQSYCSRQSHLHEMTRRTSPTTSTHRSSAGPYCELRSRHPAIYN